jgi:hypothetical protein
MSLHLRLRCFGLLLVALPQTLCAEISITLQNEFINHYKARVTVDTNYVVDRAHPQPNTPAKDGDLHIAGRAEEVKLPIVAEIMNARDDQAAVDAIHNVEGTGRSIPLTGIWRLWCEHGGNSEQIQGEPLEPFETTNPPHVFEIHPVTALNGRSLLPTLKPIVGFDAKDAHDAFVKYEGLRSTIIPNADTTTIVTTMAGFNYVEFVMEINSESRDTGDGRMVFAKVLDLEGELLVHNRRMVMVKDSEIEKQTRGKPLGTRVHVLGLPRIDLSLVAWRVQAAAGGRNEVLTWTLPYEIIVVGFYEFAESDEVARERHAVRPIESRSRPIPRTLTPADLNRIWRMPAGPERDAELGPATRRTSPGHSEEEPRPRPRSRPSPLPNPG